MDLLLDIADTYALDALYSRLLPISAFGTSSSNFTSATTAPLLSSGISGKWTQLVSHLPHPPVVDILADAGSRGTLYKTMAGASVSAWPRDYFPRQCISVFVLTLIGIHVLYFLFAGLSYHYIFNKEMMRHPRFLKNQVRLEIESSLRSFPGMITLTLPWFMGEVRGYSRLYDDVEGVWGWTYLVLSVPAFLLFTDYCIYWIHRWLHLPAIYKYIHKPHHKWIVPTPFASHAFHPLDGYAQSIPYHAFVFLFPLHRLLYLGLFVAVNFWAIFIHDSDMITGHPLEKVINGPAHHTLHHIFFTVNYGQYFTWADRAGGSYRQPESSLDPMLEIKAMDEAAAKMKSQ